MNKMVKDEEIKKQVERIGIVCDKDGFPPLAGRLLGFLMLAEPPYKSFDEIVEFLQASKSAVSNTLKFLETQGMVDYTTFPGDRKRYFRMSVENWASVVLQKIDFIKLMKEKLTEVLEIRSAKYAEFNQNLHDIIKLYDVILEAFPQIIARWEESRKK